MTTYLAVDAGQGGTRASLRTDDGVVLSQAEAGGVRHLGAPDGPASTATVVSKAVHIAIAGRPHPRIGVVAISGWSADPARRAELMALLGTAFPAMDVWLTSDAVAGFFALPPDGPRVSLAVGTGAIAAAADGSGDWAVVDGVGHLLGDDGSGFWVGQRGLASALAAADGRGGSEVLLRRAIERLGDASLIPERVYGAPDPVVRVAAFAPDVLAAAIDGDPVSGAIVDEAGALLARTADAAATRIVGDGAVSVVLTGGLAGQSERLEHALTTALGRRRPGTHVRRVATRPIDGAAYLAADPGLLEGWFPGLYSHGSARA